MLWFVFFSFLSLPIFATDSPSSTKSIPTELPAELDVEKLKERYWLKGSEENIGVVQNRMYKKKQTIELGFLGGNLRGDPFLSIYNIGGTLGYHISEFVALHAVYWDASVNPSSALTTLESDTHTTANVNKPKNFMGGEARASVLYGKLSLLGAAILYFDAYFSLGAGKISTESGDNIAFTAGLGQQIHISKLLALTFDFKFLRHNETILGKGVNNFGQNLGVRSNLSNAIMIGISFFADPFGG